MLDEYITFVSISEEEATAARNENNFILGIDKEDNQ